MGLIGDIIQGVIGVTNTVDALTGGPEARAWDLNKKGMDLQQEYNLQNMAKEQEYSKDLIDYQNEYNLPSEQLNRAKNAGINPLSVITGNMNIAPSAGGSSASSGSISSDLSGAAAIEANRLQQMTQISQVANNIAQNRLLDAETKNKNADTKVKEKDVEQKAIFNKYADGIYSAQLSNTEEQTKLYISQSELNKENKNVLSEQVKTMEKQREVYDAEIKKTNEEVKSIAEDVRAKAIDNFFRKESHQLSLALTRANISKVAVDTLLSYANIEQVKAYTLNLYKQQEVMQSQIELNASNKTVSDLQGTSLRIQNGIAGLTFNLLQDYGPTEKVVGIAKDLLIGLGAVAAGAAGAIKAYKSGPIGNNLNGYSGSTTSSQPTVYQ